MKYRITGKALIHQNDQILFVSFQDDQGPFFSLPGGKQEVGETIKETVARECMEELGIQVIVNRLAFINEFIFPEPLSSEWETGVHQLEIVFHCTPTDLSQLGSGTQEDLQQTGIHWISLHEFSNHRIYPHTQLGNYIKADEPLEKYHFRAD